MATTEPLRTRIAERMEEIRTAGLSRLRRPPSGIDLCSNDYLNLSQHFLLKDRMIAAIRREGCGSTGSRLLRGERDCFARIEQTFATFKQTESALYFSSGYLANIAVLTAFPEIGDVIYSDERNHASLIDGIRLSSARRIVFPHNDVATLDRLLDQHRDGRAFVVVESLFGMDGDEAPLTEYARVCRRQEAALVVDEAHAVGLYGNRGSGLIEARGVDGDVFVSVNTAGKALGVSGAFVTGPSWAIDFLAQSARPFVFSTAPPPALAAALEASLAIVAAEPERREMLARLSLHLRTCLNECGIAPLNGASHIISIVLGDNERAVDVAQMMQAEGFDVRAIRPPTVPSGTARLRITVNVALTEPVLDRFVTVLATALAVHSRCSAVSS